MSTFIFTLLLVFNFFAFFHASALGDGSTCSQMGTGPDDMIMESPSGLIAMNPKYMWDKRGHVVRVPIVLEHAYSPRERGIIFAGLQEIASKTCVKFAVHKDPHHLRGHDFVYIQKTKSKGCWSYVGRVGNGKQDLSLPIGCINHRTVVHEVMHALGFSHEHVRHDRDNYVEILWGNIQRGRERNFEKKHGRADPFGPYDYDSIMHYERNAFSSNGHDTISPLRPAHIGRGRHMSHWDVIKINRMYKCGRGGGGGGYGGGGGVSPFFGFDFGGHPGGNELGGDGDDDSDGVPFDDNNGQVAVSGGGAGVTGLDDDSSITDVFNNLDNDPTFDGLFSAPGGPTEGGGSRPPRGQQITRPNHGPFPTGPLGPLGHAHPSGPGGGPSPLLSGPDYDDRPKGPPPKIPLGSPGHSFPDNPFANIPSNPFSPRSGLPSNGIDDTAPGVVDAEYFDTQQDPTLSKDYFSY